MINTFPFYGQLDAMDCGPSCLRMIAKYYGRSIPLEYLRRKSQFGRDGVSMLGLSEAAESIGLKSAGVRITIEQLINDVPLPAIVHWDNYHFVVVTPATGKKNMVIADPAKGIIKLTKDQFKQHWVSNADSGTEKGLTLLIERSPLFKDLDLSDKSESKRPFTGWSLLSTYASQYRSSFFQIFIGLFLGSALQLAFPFLTQSIVDTGVNTQDLNFIELILIAQLMLLFSQTMIGLIRSRILLHISIKINLSILSGFWSKLLKLPIAFFQSKHPGDILQRIGDHERIENFITGTALESALSLLNIVVFSIVLFSYSSTVFFVFACASIIYVLWIRYFLHSRRKLEYKRFRIASQENNATMQLVYGMQEIKLNNAENTFRWTWENLRVALFKINYQNLNINQVQQIGALFINQGKNIIITFLVAKLAIEGKVTLGMMLAIQYILGQLNSPIEQIISFSQQTQDAKMSIERLNDVHAMADEEPPSKQYLHSLPAKHDILLKNISFAYPGAGSEPVLRNINLTIPEKKVTAIVGMSGSGKTTINKLLLRLYDDYKGDIYVGSTNLKHISPKFWRSISGAVMQDAYIFNHSIAKNITVTDDKIDFERLLYACNVANILTFIESLPHGLDTQLGSQGNDISGGQRQRIAIARAVYKDPQFLFLDEATNSLDANNEKVITENLGRFFRNRTVMIIAHRLSTIKNADKIIMVDEGQVIEEGTHQELLDKNQKYYELVKNQV